MKKFPAVLALVLSVTSSCSNIVWTENPTIKPSSRTAIVYYPTAELLIPLSTDLTYAGRSPWGDWAFISANDRNYKFKAGNQLYIPISQNGAVISTIHEGTDLAEKSSIIIPAGEQDIYLRVVGVYLPLPERVSVTTSHAGTFIGYKTKLQFNLVSKNFALKELR